jgi:hypothetical protein
LYVFHVESAIEAFTNESISVVKVSWPKLWEEMDILKDISFLELFPVVVALCIWGEQLKTRKLFLT